MKAIHASQNTPSTLKAPYPFKSPSQSFVREIIQWLELHINKEAHLISDSRAISMGDAYCAYAIEGADNRIHIQKAIENGAKALLIEADTDPALLIDIDIPTKKIHSLDLFIGPIASEWYGVPSASMNLIGITGTNGKTSCSHWIAQALTNIGQPCAILGTVGAGAPDKLIPTGFTTPQAPQLQQLLCQFQQNHCKAVAMEVSSHALQQGRVNGTFFKTAVFTNLTQDHLDFHHHFSAYEAAKAKLFDWPTLETIVINADDPIGQKWLTEKQGKVRTIAYSTQKNIKDSVSADEYLIATNMITTTTGTALSLLSSFGNADLEIPVFGLFNVSNVLAVLGVLISHQIPFNTAIAQLKTLQPVNGRMQQLGGKLQVDEPLIVIDYAHTPDALEKTLTALQPAIEKRGGKLITIFGCGGDRDKGKRPLMGTIAARLSHKVVLTSDNPRYELSDQIIDDIAQGIDPNFPPSDLRKIDDRASAILQTIRSANREDIILLAGKGHETTQEIAGKKRPFSDQDHVLLALAARNAGGKTC